MEINLKKCQRKRKMKINLKKNLKKEGKSLQENRNFHSFTFRERGVNNFRENVNKSRGETWRRYIFGR